MSDTATSNAPASTSESAGGPPMGGPWGASVSDIEMTQNELMFGLATLTMAFTGVKIWTWYPKNIRNNNLLYPDRIDGTTTHDEEWALYTREISAWTNAY